LEMAVVYIYGYYATDNEEWWVKGESKCSPSPLRMQPRIFSAL